LNLIEDPNPFNIPKTSPGSVGLSAAPIIKAPVQGISVSPYPKITLRQNPIKNVFNRTPGPAKTTKLENYLFIAYQSQLNPDSNTPVGTKTKSAK